MPYRGGDPPSSGGVPLDFDEELLLVVVRALGQAVVILLVGVYQADLVIDRPERW